VPLARPVSSHVAHLPRRFKAILFEGVAGNVGRDRLGVPQPGGGDPLAGPGHGLVGDIGATGVTAGPTRAPELRASAPRTEIGTEGTWRDISMCCIIFVPRGPAEASQGRASIMAKAVVCFALIVTLLSSVAHAQQGMVLIVAKKVFGPMAANLASDFIYNKLRSMVCPPDSSLRAQYPQILPYLDCEDYAGHGATPPPTTDKYIRSMKPQTPRTSIAPRSDLPPASPSLTLPYDDHEARAAVDAAKYRRTVCISIGNKSVAAFYDEEMTGGGDPIVELSGTNAEGSTIHFTNSKIVNGKIAWVNISSPSNRAELKDKYMAGTFAANWSTRRDIWGQTFRNGGRAFFDTCRF
jgi:hypothetical protein